MGTRTHTVYFGDDSLDDLDAAIAAIDKDVADRGKYFSEDVQSAMARRLAVLHAARELLAEPVPDSYY